MNSVLFTRVVKELLFFLLSCVLRSKVFPMMIHDTQISLYL